MQLPKTIKIGESVYTVSTVKDLKNDKGTKLYGQISYQNECILIDRDISSSRQYNTLLHEICHGIFDHFGHTVPEKTVEHLGTGLAMVLKDNPQLRRYLLNT